MSDLHEPDLDRAFAALTSDLSTHSSAPGAGAAMATARKRRRTRMGAVALVAAAAVAAVTVPQLVDGRGDGSVAGELDLPAPAPVSATSLTAATEGWAGPWEDIDKSNAGNMDGLDSNCLAEFKGSDADPERVGDRVFVADGTGAFMTFVDYANAPGAAGELAAEFSQALGACGATATESTRGGGVVIHGSGGRAPGSDVDEVWFARLGDRVALVAIMGPTSPAPERTGEALTDLLLAALQDDSSFEVSYNGLDVQPDEGSSNTTPSSFNDIPLAQIREATGAWSQEWTNGQPLDSDNLPCFPAGWPEASAWGQGSTIGDRGTLTFAESDRATAEISELTAVLYACGSGPWAIHDGAGAQRTAMWAAYDGGSLFVAERANYVAALQVRGLDVPSEETATRLIEILEETLANPGSYSGTPPQPSETAEP